MTRPDFARVPVGGEVAVYSVRLRRLHPRTHLPGEAWSAYRVADGRIIGPVIGPSPEAAMAALRSAP